MVKFMHTVWEWLKFGKHCGGPSPHLWSLSPAFRISSLLWWLTWKNFHWKEVINLEEDSEISCDLDKGPPLSGTQFPIFKMGGRMGKTTSNYPFSSDVPSLRMEMTLKAWPSAQVSPPMSSRLQTQHVPNQTHPLSSISPCFCSVSWLPLSLLSPWLIPSPDWHDSCPPGLPASWLDCTDTNFQITLMAESQNSGHMKATYKPLTVLCNILHLLASICLSWTYINHHFLFTHPWPYSQNFIWQILCLLRLISGITSSMKISLINFPYQLPRRQSET